jgi:hypothetical protein
MHPTTIEFLARDRIADLERDGVGQRALAREAGRASATPTKARSESRPTISLLGRLIRVISPV